MVTLLRNLVVNRLLVHVTGFKWEVILTEKRLKTSLVLLYHFQVTEIALLLEPVPMTAMVRHQGMFVYTSMTPKF